MLIKKEEERDLCISEHNTVDWRRQNNIPDSDHDGIPLGQTRKELTQLQQLIPIAMTKKEKDWKRIVESILSQ